MTEPSEGFLARWSRIKREAPVAEPPVAVPQLATPDAALDAPPSGAAQSHDAETVDLATLPRIEDLAADSDFTRFLQKGVPDELRRLALRKAWALDPAIRDFIEMAENQYDWNAPDGVPGFGSLAPGTDLSALLAQAIGATPPADLAEQQPESPAAPPVASSAPGPEVEIGDVRDTTSATPKAQPLDMARPADVASNADPDASRREVELGSTTRRRHGGALPT